MKNPTILKDELSLLRADKSKVITELTKKGGELKEVQQKIFEEETRLAEVKATILEETARLDDIRGRAVLIKTELTKNTQELKNIQNSIDISSTKNSQEEKRHLGRIKELEELEKEITANISNLKSVFDRNSKVYNQNESERAARLRAIQTQIAEAEQKLKETVSQLDKKTAEEKKLTKDRLKREDKIRARERNLDAKEYALGKREEDLITMSKDITIVYGRLRELYSKHYPDVDLDKLILKAL